MAKRSYNTNNANNVYNKETKEDGFADTCRGVIQGVVTFFMLILVLVFPLVYHNSYFDILETKYQCYYLSVIGMLVIMLVLALIMCLIDFKENGGEHVKSVCSQLYPKNWRKTFSLADGAVILFWLTALISTLQSDYLYESFWGNEGRYSGLFLLTLYVAFFFAVSRCWKIKGWILETFLISGMIMCVIGITDYFQMDVLQFRGNMKPAQSAMFTSTVGNINTYTAYVALVMGLSAAMFATAKKTGRMIWYYCCMVISFFAIIMGCSDNAYLALGALFAFLPLAVFEKRSGVKRYLIMLATFFTVVQCIVWTNAAYADVVIAFDGLIKIAERVSALPALTAGLWLIVIAVLILERAAGQKKNDQANPWMLRGWLILIGLGVLAVLFMLYDANAGGNAQRYGALSSYLVMDDHWGTFRGYIWRQTIEMYRQLPFMHKLFGYGPDTFGILSTNMIHFEMISATTQIYDNVHNEYLQYFITVGPIGMAAYITFLVSAGRRIWKMREKNVYMIGCLLAVICYAVQATVNLNLPIATPVMWLLLSVGIAGSRLEK